MTKLLDTALDFLRSPGAMMIALVIALFPQGEHTAQVFQYFSHDGSGNAAGLSYAFAAAVEVAVLLFVLAGHKRISGGFAFASFLTNVVYYAIGGVALLSVAVFPVLLLSALLPACIMGYSHTVADKTRRDNTNTAPAATSARRRWQWWRKVDAPATQPVQQDAAPHAPTLHIIAVDDALGDAAQPDARAVALQMAEEGCTVAQIAAQVDAKPATVRSWIARERAKRNGSAPHA